MLCCSTEDFASSVSPAPKKSKSESKGQVKDDRKKQKENNNIRENNAAERGYVFAMTCILFLLLFLFFRCSCYNLQADKVVLW